MDTLENEALEGLNGKPRVIAEETGDPEDSVAGCCSVHTIQD